MADRVDVERLLYDGETVEESVSAGSARLVVTTHRVLAVTPTGSGPNFSYADRPNVEGVERDTTGGSEHLVRAVKAVLAGVVLAAAGLLVDLDGLIGTRVGGAAAGQVGLGRVLALLDVLRTALAHLDDALVVAGAVAALVGAAFFGLYVNARESSVVVRVAGGDDLHLPAAFADRDLAAVRRHLDIEDSV